MRRIFWVAFLLAASAFLAPRVASAEPPFDPAQADAIALRILPAPEDLPGGGWIVTMQANAVPETENTQYPDTPACNNSLGYWAKAASKHKDGTVAGMAIEGLSKPGPSALSLPTQAELIVEIHEDDAYLDRAMDNTRDIFSSPDLTKCLGDLFGQTAGGAKVAVTDVAPGADVPNGGIARAVELKLGNELVSLTMRMEFYVWVYGIAVAEVSVFGGPSSLTPDLPAAIVSKLQAGLEREAGR